MAIIGVSILDIDFTNLDKNLKELKSIGVSDIHIDVIDTTFAPNISFGPAIINSILKYDFNFQLHLMIKDPEVILDKINTSKISSIIVHHKYDLLRLKYNNVGIAINPDSNVPTTNPKSVLIMTVEPGFGGQKIIEKCLEKIEIAKKMNIFTIVDGGINAENIHLAKNADYIVVGSALIKSENKKEYYERLLKNID